MEWKQYNGMYYVNELGEVKSLMNGILKGNDKCGYRTIRVYGKMKFIHRMVAEMFIPNPENKPEINHKNGIKSNNHIENLEWCTGSENSVHAFKTGLRISPTGENHGRSKVNNQQVKEIRTKYSTGDYTYKQLVKEYGITITAIRHIIINKTYTT